jgi:hypothetical protein
MKTETSSSFGYVLTILGLLALPFTACVAIMLLEPGVKIEFFKRSMLIFALMVGAGVAISFVAHTLWERKGGS